MGDEPQKNDGLIVWVTNPRKMMVSLYGWRTQEKNDGLIVWVTNPRKMMVSLYGWRTQVEDRKNMKWSHCYGWPTQLKDVMWQVWKMGLTWRSPEGMIEEGPENLVLLDNSWSQGLKTRCFLIARLIFSFLWDFPNSKVYLIFFPFQGHNHGSLLLSAQWFSLFSFFSSLFFCPQSC